MSHPYPPLPDQRSPQDHPRYSQQATQQYAHLQEPPPFGTLSGGYADHGGYQQHGPRKGSGLAISALVLGIIALLLCWVPIINNVAAVLAVVGLALGIPALVSARRGTRTGSGLAVAGVVLSVLALAGVLATQAFYGAVIDEVTDELNDELDDPAGLAPGDAGAPAAGADAVAPADTSSVLPLGQPGQLAEYTVTVDSVTTNGNDIVAAENSFNSPPTGQYVLVGLTVTYNGTEEGDPWLDLSPEFVGSDARMYDTSSCMAVIPGEASNVPTLLTGGTASYQVCMDLPPAAIEGGRIEVSETFSFDDASVSWAIQ